MSRGTLIFSSSSGHAHQAIAEAVAQELRARGNGPVTVIDVHSFLTPLGRWYFSTGQFLLLSGLARGSRFVMQQAQQMGRFARWSSAYYPLDLALARRIFTTAQPAAVVATHLLGAVVTQRVGYTAPVVLLPVNYEAHRWHIQPIVATYCAPHALVADDFRRLGVAADRFRVTGMPTARAYDTLPARVEAQRAVGLPGGQPVVMVSQGAMGSGIKTVPLVLHLLNHLPPTTHFLVMMGNNRTTALVLRTMKLPARVHVFDFVDNFHLYLKAADVLLGKAGGSSSTAAFLAETALVIYAPNAHEFKSAARFVAAGVALSAAGSVKTATQHVTSLLEDPAHYRSLVEAARSFVVPRARQTVADLIGEIVRVRKTCGKQSVATESSLAENLLVTRRG